MDCPFFVEKVRGNGEYLSGLCRSQSNRRPLRWASPATILLRCETLLAPASLSVAQLLDRMGRTAKDEVQDLGMAGVIGFLVQRLVSSGIRLNHRTHGV